MKMPPFLMGATLLFWGYQTNFLPVAVVMALILESSRVVRARWEFSDDEFSRVWTFCSVLLLAAIIFAFKDNGGFSGLGELFQHPDFASERDAGNASTMTADALFRWLPMIFFLFIAAQTFSPAGDVPLEAVSFYLRSRLKKARRRGQLVPPSRRFDASYPYFAICLFSAGAGPQNDHFYYGLCPLIAWALWPFRSRRFKLPVWIMILGIAIVVGFWGQRAVTQVVRLAGQYDPQLLSLLWHFKPDPKQDSNEADLHSGKLSLSGKIVIRLEPLNGAHPPTYLREASYRKFQESVYGGHRQMAWEAGNTNNDYPEVYETPRDSGVWPLNGATVNRSVVNISCYLSGANPNDKYPEGLLPLPPDCNRLESLRAYFVYQNNIGAVLAEGPRLMIFDARFGSGQVVDARPEADTYVTNEDLLVPTNEMPAINQVISQLNLSGKNEDEKLLAISQFFANNFTYSLQQDAPTPGAPALARFLLQTRKGYCEYFATATVLLLRQLGIPARYVVGYYVHEASGHGYIVRERDAHAWCLVWDEKEQVWKNFDTTPASWVTEEQDAASLFQFFSDFASWLEFRVLKFFEYGHSNIRDYLFWGLIPALAFMLYRIFRSSRRSKKDGDSLEHMDWPGLDSEFYLFERRLAQLGLPRQLGEPLSTWLRRATDDSGLAEFKEPLENILRLHYRHRFDPRGLSPAERRELRRQVESLLFTAFAK
jgi:hypothetical protein